MASVGRGTAASPAPGVRKDSRDGTRHRSGDDDPGPGFLAVGYAVLFVLGATLGLLGAFFLSAGPRTGSTLVLPIGLLVALVGHPLAGRAGLEITGTRAGTLTPLLGWAAVIVPLSSGTAQGDVILPNSLLAVAYLVVGLATYGATAVFTRPRRGRSAWGRPPER